MKNKKYHDYTKTSIRSFHPLRVNKRFYFNNKLYKIQSYNPIANFFRKLFKKPYWVDVIFFDKTLEKEVKRWFDSIFDSTPSYTKEPKCRKRSPKN
jgi:hypothetical protein